jgi:hypothetical protein
MMLDARVLELYFIWDCHLLVSFLCSVADWPRAVKTRTGYWMFYLSYFTESIIPLGGANCMLSPGTFFFSFFWFNRVSLQSCKEVSFLNPSYLLLYFVLCRLLFLLIYFIFPREIASDCPRTSIYQSSWKTNTNTNIDRYHHQRADKKRDLEKVKHFKNINKLPPHSSHCLVCPWKTVDLSLSSLDSFRFANTNSIVPFNSRPTGMPFQNA